MKQLDDYARLFADRLIEALKKGTAPWQKPWKPGELSSPLNPTTGRHYRGNNAILLMITGAIRGYSDTRWAGFGQIRRAGGMVRRGEKGTPVIVWRSRGPATPAAEAETDDESTRSSFYCTMHHVFNVEQADGLELKPVTAPAPGFEPHAAVRQVADDAHVRIVHLAGDRACYSPRRDTITMPEPGQFRIPGSYEHTLLHELAHATSHPSRLDRDVHHVTDRRSPAYAIEELRAEIAAMMLGEKLLVGHEPRHGEAYVASWIKALDDDPAAIRKASADAQHISDWLTRNIPRAERPAGKPMAA